MQMHPLRSDDVLFSLFTLLFGPPASDFLDATPPTHTPNTHTHAHKHCDIATHQPPGEIPTTHSFRSTDSLTLTLIFKNNT